MLQLLAGIALYAGILGFFVTIAVWINGRRTTREIREIIFAISEKLSGEIEELSKQTRQITEQTRWITEQTRQISKQTQQTSEKISQQTARSEKSTKQILMKMDEKLNEILKS